MWKWKKFLTTDSWRFFFSKNVAFSKRIPMEFFASEEWGSRIYFASSHPTPHRRMGLYWKLKTLAFRKLSKVSKMFQKGVHSTYFIMGNRNIYDLLGLCEMFAVIILPTIGHNITPHILFLSFESQFCILPTTFCAVTFVVLSQFYSPPLLKIIFKNKLTVGVVVQSRCPFDCFGYDPRKA